MNIVKDAAAVFCSIGRLIAAFGFVFIIAQPVLGATPADYAVQVSATVQTNPPQITLYWPKDPSAFSCSLARKLRGEYAWGREVSLPPGATNYVDSTVNLGGSYEYRISRAGPGYNSSGYIYAGIASPLVDSRGTVVLLVDNTFVASLTNELARLQEDLKGDGWTVKFHAVPRMAVDPANLSSGVWASRSNELATIKELIKSDYYSADLGDVRAVLILGHVPVPYSGDVYPDQHPSHQGAWPADAFYADVDSVWTDSSLTSTGSSDLRNRNVPGDGKFDQSLIASDLELAVGRIDFASLPAFAEPETELLRRYLNKNHRFRHKLFTAGKRGLIDDHLGLSTTEPLASNGWRNFAPLLGPTNTIAADWLTTLCPQPSPLNPQPFLWGYGCGGGSFTSCSGVATTSQLATNDPQVVFSMLFGSYFGDWDSPNNLLRAAIATTNFTLSCAWVGRPSWYFHHMGLGETIGFSTRLSQNNDGVAGYWGVGANRMVHVALMGDPTLRMQVVAPPAALVAVTNLTGGVDLSWSPSADDVLGYHVYRAPAADGPFTRITSSLVATTNYSDSLLARCTYMVRAVRLEETASGSFYNASQGVFADFSPPTALPLLVIKARDLTKVYGEPVPPLTASYTGFLNGDTPTDLDSPAALSTPATAGSPVGTFPIHLSGAADSNYVVVLLDGTLTNRPALTAASLSSSACQSLPGQEVTLTCTLDVVAPGVGTPSGSVQFIVDGADAGPPVSLSGRTATYSDSALGIGFHRIEAVYSGDANFAGTTAILSPDQLVNTAPVAHADIIERDPTNGVTVPITTLLSNDADADGDLIFWLSAWPTTPNGGTVTSDMDFVTYTPAPGFTNIDTFTYQIADSWNALATGLVTVTLAGHPLARPTLAISNLNNGSLLIHGSANPGLVSRIQFLDNLGITNWQTLGSATSNPSGTFQFFDLLTTTQRFYRTIIP